MTTYSFKIVPLFKATIVKGVLMTPDTERGRMAKWAMTQKDGEVDIKLSKKTKPRSLKQNAALWAIPVTIIYENTYGQWDNEDDVYHFLEDKFAPRKMVQVGKEVRTIPKKLKELNSTEFGEVYLKIQAWGAQELALEIPSPDKEYLAHELQAEIERGE